jgi:hypothetical protein
MGVMVPSRKTVFLKRLPLLQLSHLVAYWRIGSFVVDGVVDTLTMLDSNDDGGWLVFPSALITDHARLLF